jgi:hypothetical protein
VDSELDQPEGQRPGAQKPEDPQHDPGLGPTVHIPPPPPADTAPWTPSWDAPGVQPPGYRPLVSASDDTDPSIPPVPAYPENSPQDAPPRPGAQPPYPGSPPPGGPPYPGAQTPTAFAYPGAQPPGGGYRGAQQQAGGYPGAQPPYPYPGQQVQTGYPGQYPGYYQQQPPPRKSRRGLITGIVVGAVVVIAAAVTAVVLLLPKNVAPTTIALKSGQAVAASSGLTLTGSIAGGDATVSVTRAGTVEGSYSQNGNPVSRITINGVTYLKASRTFWRSTSVGATSATQAGGKWARAPADAVNMRFDSFTPAQVSRVLEHVGKNPRVTRITLGGIRVIRLVVGATTYYIATASPYRLIRIDGVSNTKRYSFDITELSAATIGPVFAALHADAQTLHGAIDPEAIVLPLEKIKFSPDCSAAVSCHVSSRVSVTRANAPRVMVTMTVDFSAVENGKPFATCVDRTPTPSFATVSQSCGVGGSVWSGWFNSHTGNFTTWAHARFEVTVNSASDIDALQGELNQEQQAG